MSDFKWPTAYVPCDSYSAASTPPLTETKKGLLERLDKWSAVWWQARGEIKGGNPKEEDPEILLKEAARVLREALSVIEQAESLIRNGGIVPVKGEAWSRLDAFLTKYQETK